MCFLPHTRRLPGRKVLLGDNLSSHFSHKVIQLAADNNISFACLPPNATRLLQPLDVAFFVSLKSMWRRILDSWKGMKRSRTVKKKVFPQLLKKLLDSVYPEERSDNRDFQLHCRFNEEPSIYISRSNRHFYIIRIVEKLCSFLSEFGIDTV